MLLLQKAYGPLDGYMVQVMCKHLSTWQKFVNSPEYATQPRALVEEFSIAGATGEYVT